MKLRKLFVLLATLAMVAAACGGNGDDDTTTTTVASSEDTTTTTTQAPETTTTTTTEAPGPPVGSAENPIEVLFVPSVSAEEIIAGGELLDDALTAATGLEFEVSVGTSYAATIQEMCASPDNTIGFIPAQGYVLASDLCGVDIELKSQRFGYDVYWTAFIAPRDSDITSVEDIAGRKWAYPDATSTSGFLIPSGQFELLGIEPGEGFEAGGHSATVRAIYNNEADFGTVFFSPPTDADGNSLWNEGEYPDVPDDQLASCGLDADGQLDCSGFYPQDARRNIREENPDVVQKVKIFAVSDPIPNDGMAFGPDFPSDLKQQIVDAMIDFAASDPDGFATAFDAYSWDNVTATNDSEFDSIRALLQALGFTIDDF